MPRVSPSLWLLMVLASTCVWAAEWPTYLNGNGRIGATEATLPNDLELKWVYRAPEQLELAFPGPRREQIEGHAMRHRVAFDQALHVAAVGDRVYFGSSVDHQLYCLRADTGEPVWTFFTDAAIRLSPTVWQGKLYVGSDDGFVYCLNADTGALLWKLRAGPNDERLLARGQLISRWPVRTGILIDDGIAYFGAGVFPDETVYLVALDAESGAVIWKNDHISQENAGRNPLSPQGYLLASEDMLFVPSGRSLPAAFDKKTGEEVYHKSYSWRSTAGGVVGGYKAVLADGQIYASGPHHFLALDQKTGAVGFAWITGRQLTMSGDRGFVATGKKIVAMDRLVHAKATTERQKVNLELNGLRRKRREMSAEEYQEKSDGLNRRVNELSEVGTTWSADTTADAALILADTSLVAGGTDEVAIYNSGDGELIWSAAVEGKASGLAAAGGQLLVSTESGMIYAFGAPDTGAGDGPIEVVQQYMSTDADPYGDDSLSEMYATAAEQIIERTGVRRGFCLVHGSERGQLAYELARRTDLEIYGIEPNAQKVDEARKALNRAGIYGSRVTIIHADPSKLQLAHYFANLVVSDTLLLTGKLPGRPAEIASRIKPCGGVVCFGGPDSAPARNKGMDDAQLRKLVTGLNLGSDGALDLSQGYATLVRGKLSGAGDWSHQYGNVANTSMSNDHIVKGGMSVLWYGDPGPAPMVNRHEAAVAPLSTNGRMFIQGVDRILCYDAYNGLFLWAYLNPGAKRTGVFNNEECSNLAASDDSLFVAVGDTCTQLDAATGRVQAVHRVPKSADGIPRVWGYVGYYDGMLIGTSTIRKELELSLRRRGHTVTNTTDALFAMDTKTGESKWVYRGKNIMHVTIAVGDDRVFFIDSSISQQQREVLLRADKTELKKLDPEAAKQKEAELKKQDIRLAVAISAQDGSALWSKPVDVTDCSYVGIGGGQLTLMYHDGHVIICGANANGHYWRQFLSGQFSKRRLVVLNAGNGEKIWSKDANYRHRPIVLETEILAEPWSFDLSTGVEKTREHPLTGAESKWQFSRPGHHCGMITATPNSLFFRSGFTGYYDLYSDSGVSHFAGQRMGCWVNAIPGNGLLMVPEASAGCVCQFSIAATVVMEPRVERNTWKIASLGGVATPVKHMAINLGAPGDRRDGFGTLWLAYPRPKTVGRLEYSFDLDAKLASGGEFYSFNSESVQIEGTATPWLLSSGARGLTRCRLPLLSEEDSPGTYTVKLYFAELEDCQPGESMLDVRLQEERVAQDVDVVAEAGGPARALVREFAGIEVVKDLVVAIESRGETLPRLAAIEVTRD
jgi:outer membrane protein assembly factor BamB